MENYIWLVDWMHSTWVPTGIVLCLLGVLSFIPTINHTTEAGRAHWAAWAFGVFGVLGGVGLTWAGCAAGSYLEYLP